MKDSICYSRLRTLSLLISLTIIGKGAVAQQTQICNNYVDIAFLVDESGSILSSDYSLVKSYMKELVQLLPSVSKDGVQYAALRFDDSAKIVFYFNQYSNKQQVVDAIDNMPQGQGGTNPTDGFRLLRQQVLNETKGDRPKVPNLCLFITDGKPNVEVEELPNEVQRVKDTGTRIIGIGITSSVNETALKALVTDPDKDYFYVDNFSKLKTILNSTTSRVCESIDNGAHVTMSGSKWVFMTSVLGLVAVLHSIF